MTDTAAIHAASDARGGTWTDQALAAVAAYQRQRTRIQLGLSAIAMGLDQIDAGKVQDGAARTREGFEFLRKELGDGRD